MELTQEMKEFLTPSKTALLVWDVQNRLVNNIFNKDVFLSSLKALIAKAREKGAVVVFSKVTPLPEKFQSPLMKLMMKERMKRMPQSPQAPNAMDLTIAPLENDIVIPKNTASMFIGTNFEMILRNAGVTTIVLAGIATEFGVESTARDASNRGFFPVIISDAVSSFDEAGHKRSLENMKNMMVVMETKDIISIW
jgi:nicotinamidase-related amidase